VTVFVLTDEEMAAIDGLDVARPPGSRPHLDALPNAERVTAVRAALRGLVARGLVQRPPAGQLAAARRPRSGATSTVELPIAEELRNVLTARQSAERLVVARRDGDAPEQHHLYVGRATVLAERIDGGGLHAFDFLSAGRALTRLMALVLDGPALSILSLSIDPASSAPPVVLGVVMTATGLRLAEGADPKPADDVDPATLRLRLADLLAPRRPGQESG
jgi:hypothetical protein